MLGKGINRRSVFAADAGAVADGQSQEDFRRSLKINEGGLGWVDSWLVTSSVEDGPRLDLCNRFIRISSDLMKGIGEVAGCSTTIDLRSISSEEGRKLYLMDRSNEIADLLMFDQPSSPENGNGCGRMFRQPDPQPVPNSQATAVSSGGA